MNLKLLVSSSAELTTSSAAFMAAAFAELAMSTAAVSDALVLTKQEAQLGFQFGAVFLGHWMSVRKSDSRMTTNVSPRQASIDSVSFQ